MNIEKNKGVNSDSKLRFIINYCPKCGAKLNFYKTKTKTSICPNCNEDLNEPFDQMDDKNSSFLICTDCTFPNPINVKFCAKCGSKTLEMTIEKKPEKEKLVIKKQPIYRRRSFHYFISLLIASPISTYLVLGVARNYLIVKNIVAVVIIFSFSILLSFFIFIILSFFIKPK